jgi:aminoethylphosphonate catabolism LysR family transcriptional regulator
MNHTALRAFHRVATEGSFTRAAAALRVTQPTLSAQVKALEAEYGAALFVRRARGIAPTELGRALLEVTRRLFALEEQAGEILSAARELTIGQLRLGADSPYHVMPFLAAFRRRHGGIGLQLAIGNGEEVMEDLLTQRVDVAVLADPAEDARLHAVPCGRHRLAAIVPKRHPLAARRRVALVALARETVVLREPGSRTRRIFEAALAQAGLAAESAIEIGTREGVREAVAAGLGIGIVSAAELGHDDRLAALRLEGEGLETREYVVCLAERRALRIVAAFFKVVDEVLRVSPMLPDKRKGDGGMRGIGG